MSKLIQSIQFDSKYIMLDYGDKIFQICRACCHSGEHVKDFLEHFCPEISLELIDETLAIQLERRFYNTLINGRVRQAANEDAYNFGEYVERRCIEIQNKK